MKEIDPLLHDRLAALIRVFGCELLGCELVSQGKQQIFRIYIDNANGITSDDCLQVSRQVNAMLDVENPIQGRYILEVSSPGIDRPLFELAHYQKYIGSRIKIKLRSMINQRRQYKGILLKVAQESIYLLMDDQAQEIVLPFSSIEKANLIGEANSR